MAYKLARASSQYINVDWPDNTTGIVSIGMRFKLDSAPVSSAASARFAILGRCNTSVQGYYAYISNTTICVCFYNGGYQESAFAWTPDTNAHSLGIVWDFSGATAAIKCYLDGSSIGSETPSRGTVTSSANSFIGWVNNSGGAGYFDGNVSEVAAWSAELTAVEWASLKVCKPSRVRPASLVRYWPLVRTLQDVRSATSITGNNTPTVQPHPNVY